MEPQAQDKNREIVERLREQFSACVEQLPVETEPAFVFLLREDAE